MGLLVDLAGGERGKVGTEMMNGKLWVKLWQRISLCPALRAAPEATRWVWVVLLTKASLEPLKYYNRKTKTYVTLPPGSLRLGTIEFAETCAVTRDKLRHALKYLAQCQMITTEVVDHATNVTITNWASYQGRQTGQPNSDNQTIPTPAPDQPQAGPSFYYQREKIEREKNKYSSSSADAADGFSEFWSMYPRKVGKTAAHKAWIRAIEAGAKPETILAELRKQVPGYRDPQYTPHPTTWLNQGRWQDEPTLEFAGGERRLIR